MTNDFVLLKCLHEPIVLAPWMAVSVLGSISSSYTSREIVTHPRGDKDWSVCKQYYMEPRLQVEKVHSDMGHY